MEEHVALQALHERCRALQRRLELAERDNAALAAGLSNSAPHQLNPAQLVRERAQLAAHVLLVAQENRRLWAALALEGRADLPCAVPLLARAHAPPATQDHAELHLTNAELLQHYQQLVHDNAASTPNCLDNYGNDTLTEIRKRVDAMAEIKNQILQQQCDIKKIISNVKIKKTPESKCHKCGDSTIKASDVTKQLKNIALDSSGPESTDSLKKCEGPNFNLGGDVSENRIGNNVSNKSADSVWNNSIQVPKSGGKKKDNICPLCGVNFFNLNFDKFELHVESHFLADEDSDSICDNNYEMVFKS